MKILREKDKIIVSTQIFAGDEQHSMIDITNHQNNTEISDALDWSKFERVEVRDPQADILKRRKALVHTLNDWLQTQM